MNPLLAKLTALLEPKGSSGSSGALGTGLAQGGADLIQLQQQHQQEQIARAIRGEPPIQLQEWLAEQGIQNPAMQR